MIEVRESRFMQLYIEDFANRVVPYYVNTQDFGPLQQIVIDHEKLRVKEELTKLMETRRENILEMAKVDKEFNISGKECKPWHQET